MLVIPSTKQIASRILDFPEPFNPVMALNDSSKPGCVSWPQELDKIAHPI